MLGIFYERVNEIKGRVTTIHNFPDDIPDEDKRNYLEVEFIPEPDNISNKRPILCVDLPNDELYYEYEDIEEHPINSKITQLQNEISELQAQNAQMLLALVEGGLI